MVVLGGDCVLWAGLCVYRARELGVFEINTFMGLLISTNEYKSMPVYEVLHIHFLVGLKVHITPLHTQSTIDKLHMFNKPPRFKHLSCDD